MQLPSLESLRCFVEGARLLRFREAARAVALTPAAFGARIKQLEDEIGAPLFARTTRVVTLTEAGLALLPHATAALVSADRAMRSARGDTKPQPIELVLGTRHELGMSWVLPQLLPLSKRLPYLSLHLYFGSGPDLLARVRSAEIDCAITSSRLAEPRLAAIPIHREDYAFVGSKKLLATSPLSKAEHAKHHTLLDTSPDLPLFSYFRDVVGAANLRFDRVVRLGGISAIHTRVLERAGVAVLPVYLIQRDLKQGRLVRIFPRVRLAPDHFRMVFRTQDPRRSVFEKLAAEMARVPLR